MAVRTSMALERECCQKTRATITTNAESQMNQDRIPGRGFGSAFRSIRRASSDGFSELINSFTVSKPVFAVAVKLRPKG
jgi:hypothetical protein